MGMRVFVLAGVSEALDVSGTRLDSILWGEGFTFFCQGNFVLSSLLFPASVYPCLSGLFCWVRLGTSFTTSSCSVLIILTVGVVLLEAVWLW